MRKYAPDYCREFCCTADKCNHSCCIGWEIDIDEESLEFYRNVKGDFGRRLAENIVTEADGTSHFCLGEEKRCPFLNSCNLCDIYTELGEENLCQICTDHPRFRNFYSDREEIGLGLCCEAAGQLILGRKKPAELVCTEDDGEEFLFEDECDFLDFRDNVFDILQDRTKPVKKRLEAMLTVCNVKLGYKPAVYWADMFMELERLDNLWDAMLGELKNANESRLTLPETEQFEIALEQLAVYFAYRHLCLDDDRLAERVKFVALSCRMIYLLWAVQYGKNGVLSIEDMAEIARVYSSEVEYSDDNMEALFDILG